VTCAAYLPSEGDLPQLHHTKWGGGVKDGEVKIVKIVKKKNMKEKRERWGLERCMDVWRDTD
jgi:hypothetical protein